MGATLPEFPLEVFFGRLEFGARQHLTASDAQALTVGEVLALGTDEQREAFEQLALSYIPTWGTPPLLDAIASTYDSVGPEHVLAFAGAGAYVVLDDSGGGESPKSLLDGAELDRNGGKRTAGGGAVEGGALDALKDSGVKLEPPPGDDGR